MKKILFFVAVLVTALSFTGCTPASLAKETVNSKDWLIGHWDETTELISYEITDADPEEYKAEIAVHTSLFPETNEYDVTKETLDMYYKQIIENHNKVNQSITNEYTEETYVITSFNISEDKKKIEYTKVATGEHFMWGYTWVEKTKTTLIKE